MSLGSLWVWCCFAEPGLSCGTWGLVPQSGIEPWSLNGDGGVRVLATGLPGESQEFVFLKNWSISISFFDFNFWPCGTS